MVAWSVEYLYPYGWRSSYARESIMLYGFMAVYLAACNLTDDCPNPGRVIR